MYKGIIETYRKSLPVSDKTPVVTLLEGNTPLIAAPRLAKSLGLGEDSVHLKFEGCNPTGSFKDRGMTLAVSKALEEGTKGILCASTGNTAASAAAYAARAGIRCLVLLPKGGVAAGKLTQALIHGAEVVAVQGNFDEALELVRQASAEFGLTVVNSINPYRLEGQKSAAFEIIDALNRTPDYQFMPVGNAGNITAYWRGYKEAAGSHPIPLPKMMGFQAAGAAPLVSGKPVANPKTIASAIRIGNPASWQGAIAARDESKGVIDAVTDREILEAYQLLAKTEGVFCEPSSAAGVAGLIKYAKRGFFRKIIPPSQSSPTRGEGFLDGLKIVCILTGHGLKDPDTVLKIRRAWKTVPATLKGIRRALKS